jgi:hypothetical protein
MDGSNKSVTAQAVSRIPVYRKRLRIGPNNCPPLIYQFIERALTIRPFSRRFRRVGKKARKKMPHAILMFQPCISMRLWTLAGIERVMPAVRRVYPVLFNSLLLDVLDVGAHGLLKMQ